MIPNEWQLAGITPIYKGKGDISRECNYRRPISVLPHVAEKFERRVCMQLLDYLESNDVITPLQSAYLKKHWTVTCLHKVVDDFCEMIDDGDMCGICFLDIEKCFDTIHHETGILWYSSLCSPVVQTISNWWNSICSFGQLFIRYQADFYRSPQGSVLGPIPFLLYLNDLPQHIKNEQCNMFADYTFITLVTKVFLLRINQSYKWPLTVSFHGMKVIDLE